MTEPQHFRAEDAGDMIQPNADVWRQEVQSRVSRYRTRRGRRIEGAFSMRFPFPPAEVAFTPAVDPEVVSSEHGIPIVEVRDAADHSARVVSLEELADEPESASAEIAGEFAPKPVTGEEGKVEAEPTVEAAPAPLPETEPKPAPVIQQRPRPKRKVIAFPRQAGASEAVYRLADPVLPERPRILDVPEELEAFPSTPFLDGLQFEATQQNLTLSSEHIPLPFGVVSRSRRLGSALLDCSLVAGAAAVFTLICHKMLPNLVLSKPVLLTAAGAPILFWGIYQYLLLVYAGRTAGMQVARIRLSTFKGTRASVRHRRSRVLGLYLSTASMIMGLLWALVDVDALCWHDRISGTYLTKRE